LIPIKIRKIRILLKKIRKYYTSNSRGSETPKQFSLEGSCCLPIYFNSWLVLETTALRSMEYAYRYGDARKLYLNVTNRCTNRCSFCVRNWTEGLGGAVLWGGAEPDLPMLQRAVGTQGPLENFREFVWCGYGEPTFRLDLILQAAPWLRSCGAKVRLNTNGHGRLIHGRDILPDLSDAADEISISMNAPNCSRYLELCCPEPGELEIVPERLWEGMVDCLARSPKLFGSVQATVVAAVLSQEEIGQCRDLAGSLGITRFRVR
jgi:TatD DNase family protein